MKDQTCAFCNPRKKDFEENGFFGYRCGDCNQATAFIVSTDHRGKLNEDEEKIVEELVKKYYPGLEITWKSKNRNNIQHFYDFLKPVKNGG
jgi:hypothetical protein